MAEGGPPGGGDPPAASGGQAGNVGRGGAALRARSVAGAPFGLALCREGTGQPPPRARAQPGFPSPPRSALSPAQVVT